MFSRRRGTKNRLTGLQAFEQWAASFEDILKTPEEPNSATIFCSLHSGGYLVNTRTLLWLGINNDIFASKVENKEKLLSLLNQEIQAADRCVQTAIELMVPPEKTCPIENNPAIERMVQEINIIRGLEEAI